MNLALLSAGIMGLIIISEIARKKLHWSQEATRKLVHICVGILLLLTPVMIQASLPLIVIGLFFSIFNFVALRKNLLPGIHIDRSNYGTVYYALSFFLLILIFWEGYKIIIIAAMMVMAVGDAAAAIVGRSFSNPHRYTLISDNKSIEGSLTMLLISGMVIFLTFILYPSHLSTMNHSMQYLAMISLFTAIIATAAEALGDHGNDNLSVPLLTAVVLYFMISQESQMQIQFIAGVFLAGITAYISFKARALTASGSMTTFILASIIYGFGGWKWTLPILIFFILSSLLSKAGKTGHEALFAKGSQRDHSQVLANGGVGGLLMVLDLLSPHPMIYLAYLGSLAAATADTWGTEIGMRFGRSHRLISTLQSVPAGTSGGITVAGTGGALLGATVLSASGYPFISVPSVQILGIIALSGLAASLVDSLLGATLQVQFKCVTCGKITEKKIHCGGRSTVIFSGITWLNNDMVNLINTIFGAIFVLVYTGLFFYY